MTTLLVIVHVIVCIALIMIVLLQTGKGADMGAVFGGGGSQTLFGASGASNFLSKATTIAAVIFMLTSLFLAYMAGNRTSGSILTDRPVPIRSTDQTGTGETPPAPATGSDNPAAQSQDAAPTGEAPTAAPTGPAGDANPNP